MLEAIALCEEISGCHLEGTYSDHNRTGDHIWWISDNSKFAAHYPNWRQKYNVRAILQEIYEYNRGRWAAGVAA
jgi:CDP-paratose 2-epimerase